MILSCPHCNVKVDKTQRVCLTCNKVMVRVCPSCAEDVSVLAVVCKYCSEKLAPQVVGHEAVAPRRPHVVVQPVPAADVQFTSDVKYVRWEDRASKGALRRWWGTWGRSVLHPDRFWREMPVQAGYCKPLKYAWFKYAQLLALAAPFVVAYGVAHASGAGIPAQFSAKQQVLLGLGYLALFPLTYVATGLVTFLESILWHVPAKLLGAKGSFQTTFRMVSYNSGVAVLMAIPVAGHLAALILSPIMNYYALRNAHGMGTWRARFLAALPLLLAAGAAVAAWRLGWVCCPSKCSKGMIGVC